MGLKDMFAAELVRRLLAAAVALVEAKRKASPGGKKITRAERRAIARALLPELEDLVRYLHDEDREDAPG